MQRATCLGDTYEDVNRKLFGNCAMSAAGLAHNTSTAQSATVTLSGTFDVGDVYAITINSTTYTYTVLLADTNLSGVATALAALVDASSAVSASATGAVITILPTPDDSTFTIAATATNRAAGTDNQTLVLATTSTQTTTVTVGGTFHAGDVCTTTLNGVDYAYTVLVGDTNKDGVATAIAALIDAAAAYTASATGSVVTIGGAAAGYFTVATAVTGSSHTLTLTAATTSTQTTTATLGGTFNVGDVYTVTLNGVAYTYTVLLANTNLTGTATALAAVIDAAAAYTATASGQVITIGGAAAGYFTTTATAVNIGVGTTDQVVAIVNSNGLVETTSTLHYCINGTAFTVAATTDILVGGAAIVAPATGALYCWYTVSVDTSGNFTATPGSSIVNVDGTTYADVEGIPPAPAGQTICGAFKVSVAAGSTFVPGVTALNAAGITTTYFDLSVVPTAGYPA